MIAEITCSGLSAAIGGCIAGTFGFLAIWWKRWRDGRDRFLAVLGEIESELDDRIDGYRQVHTTSLPRLRSAIFAIRPFVCERRFARIMKVWQIYKKPDADQLNWAFSTLRRDIHDSVSPGTSNLHVSADDWMRARLNEFRKAVG